MKFRVQMKDPDVLDDAIKEAISNLEINGLDSEELESVRELRAEKARHLCRNWFRYGEYLTVEIDTEKETCVVVASANSAA